MYHGDFALGKTFDVKFNTGDSTGPLTLAGTPSVAAYPDNSTTEITAGITLTVDLDSRSGMHNVRVVATSGNGYAAGVNYHLVLTAGTVGGVSVVGAVVGAFSIEARSALRPTTADRTLDVASTGEAGLDYNNVNLPAGAVPVLGIVDNGTAQSGSSTTIQLRSAAAFADDILNGATVVILSGTGAGQARVITDYVGSTDTATVDAWQTAPDNTSVYVVFATSPASATALPNVNVTKVNGTSQTATDLGAGVVAIKAKTDNLPTDPADASVVAADIAALQVVADAVQAKTDLLESSVAGMIDVNVKANNEVEIQGAGTTLNPWRPV